MIINEMRFDDRVTLGSSCDLIVVDESSMLPGAMYQDLLKCGVPILAVGDHGQLPPVKDTFDLMKSPDFKLERIHRQALGSPIIRASIEARQRGTISDSRTMPRATAEPWMLHYDVIITARRATAKRLNEEIRTLQGRQSAPEAGDIVLCLRNQDVWMIPERKLTGIDDYSVLLDPTLEMEGLEERIYNGMRAVVLAVSSPREAPCHSKSVTYYEAVIRFLDGTNIYVVRMLADQFRSIDTLAVDSEIASLWSYGYALTCHKMQGSEADRVIVIDEALYGVDRKRWLYTAVTRARHELVVIKPVPKAKSQTRKSEPPRQRNTKTIRASELMARLAESRKAEEMASH